MARPFDAYRDRRLAEVNARYEAFVTHGFPVTLDGVAETLQVARDVDRTNWLTLLGICDEAITAGAGDQLIEAPGIRCTSNRCYVVTYAEAAAIIRALRAWGLVAWANWGRLKDAVRDCPTRQALSDIDLNEGWP